VLPFTVLADFFLYLNFIDQNSAIDRHSNWVAASIFLSVLPIFFSAVLGYWLGEKSIEGR
jgi:hypothetical protein